MILTRKKQNTWRKICDIATVYYKSHMDLASINPESLQGQTYN